MELSLSPYQGLYDVVVPQEHLLRKIKENIDFSFVNPMLRKVLRKFRATGQKNGNDVQVNVFEEDL